MRKPSLIVASCAIGAIGVSAAAPRGQDEACAKAGIQAIQFELESASL